jgi:signal transduction histidine kinase
MSGSHEAQREAAPTVDLASSAEPPREIAQPPSVAQPPSTATPPSAELERRIRILEARVQAAEAERDRFARACREARDAQQDAEAALRAGEEILGGVTHDLRNPLGTIVMGVTTLLQAGAPADPERVRAVAERIQRQAERMTDQIVNLGDFVAIQAGRLAIVRASHAPSAIIAEANELVGPIARERGVRFDACAAADLPPIDCDAERVVQALSNLVANAVRVTPRGGSIEVGARPADPLGLVFFVRDTGPGLPPDELATLFGPRWRSKHAGYRGAGLGFAIARGIVDAHDGRIWAESRPGAGTSVYFSLTPAAG